jgi:integrase/recombinase XerD
MTHTHHTPPIQFVSPLRQRMIEDMAMRKLKPITQKGYIRSVKRLAQFLGHSPHSATAEELRSFQLDLVNQGATTTTINGLLSGLHFLFDVTLNNPDVLRKMSTIYQPRKIPIVLSQQEVKQLLEASVSLKYKAALSTAYGAGLRVSEVTHLKISDIDSRRMIIHIEQGKGDRDRQATDREEAALVSSESQPACTFICPRCSSPMIIIDTFERGQQPRAPPMRCEAA